MVFTTKQHQLKRRVEYISKHSTLTVQQLADNLGENYQTILATCYRHNLKFEHVHEAKRPYAKMKRNIFNVNAHEDWIVG